MDKDSIITGLNIAIERAREFRKKFEEDHEPFDSPEPLTFALDVLITRLKMDLSELNQGKVP